MELSRFDVILVGGQIPENVGFAARSIKAFGAGKLILVAPAFEWSHTSPAYKTASGSVDVLENCIVAPDLIEAVSSYHHVVGFSRRRHDFTRPYMDLPAWSEWGREALPGKRVALVFGAEDFGLSNADKRLCEKLVYIPLQNETLSLNLAHAVTVVLYELSRTLAYDNEIKVEVNPASHEETQRLFENAVNVLESTTFFKPGRRQRQIEVIRNLIHRLGISQPEYDFLMGMVSSLKKEIER